MSNSPDFLALILDAITEQIVVINEQGDIQFVNKSWSAFGDSNKCSVGHGWEGVNYIEECDKASQMGDEFGTKAGAGIRSVINQETSAFYFEYPCHSPEEKRWFMMRVTPFQLEGGHYFVISHQNITERKLAEEEVRSLSRLDGLTEIPNRRTFDEFLHKEWRRCVRLSKPICLAIIDIDHFKLLNDTYGHQVGDDCLIKIGFILKQFANRPGDICARYGGEEFALVWGDTALVSAKKLADKLLSAIVALNIPNIASPTQPYLTASIGLAEISSAELSEESDIITKADSALYEAKEKGRNKVIIHQFTCKKA